MAFDKNLITMNSRIPFRRNQVRRQHERRANLYPFNSPEWVAMMQASFELWPKQDRREAERRAADRRQLERRATRRNPAAARHLRQHHRSFASDILAEDEKKMIMDLFREG